MNKNVNHIKLLMNYITLVKPESLVGICLCMHRNFGRCVNPGSKKIVISYITDK